MGLVADAIGRGWANLLARPSGPLNIRFLIQPTVAAAMAIRSNRSVVASGGHDAMVIPMSSPVRDG